MSLASLQNLTVRYGKRTAIADLSVEIPEGCVGLLGPNGAGKTTLLKTLMGFLRPAGGGGTVLGLDVGREGARIRQRVGLMPELDCHIPGMNAVSLVSFAGELCGMPAGQALRRAHEVLEYCGLGEARYRDVETYSQGMRQRIKLAQALVHGPSLVFLDEPTNGLDPEGRDQMLALIRDVSHGKGVNVVVSSHLLPDIERTCDHVIVMKGGAVVTQGTIAALREVTGSQIDVELREPSEAFLAACRAQGFTIQNVMGPRVRLTFPQQSEGLKVAGLEVAGLEVAGLEVAGPEVERSESPELPGPRPSDLSTFQPATPGLGDFALAQPDAPRPLPVANVLFGLARDSGAQIRGFRPAQRSLEDVFLEALE